MAIATPPPARWLPIYPARSATVLLILLVTGPPGGTVASADEEGSRESDTPVTAQRTPDGPAYAVSQFVIQYATPHAEHPPLDTWLPVDVLLGLKDARYTAPQDELPSETVSIQQSSGPLRVYHASALASICRQLVSALQELGLIGLYITPHASDIDSATEADLRRSGDTVLRLTVSTGQLRRIRTVALSHTAADGSRIDSVIHRRIREGSPLQPPSDAREGTTDLLRKDALEDYLHRLNRHPGRYVEAALAPGPNGEGVDLDFRINEGRPWQAFLQTSNTGTSQTAKWQTRIGFIHRQLTRRDDILSFDYMNAGLDKVHALNVSYEAPWFQAKRPSWWKKSGREPRWLAWFNRDRIPWWGASRLRWRIAGSYTDYEATGVGRDDSSDLDFFGFDGTEWSAEGSLRYNFFQRGGLFLDLVGGLRLRGVQAISQETRNLSSPLLLLPLLALRLERQQELSSIFAEVGFETNVLSIDDPQNLGRGGADPTWKLLSWDAVTSHYLEPLLYPKAWRDTSTPATSTLAHEIYFSTRGQYAFGHRLISQATQVVGGLYSVRGYPQSTATGDDVYTGTFEYRLHLPRILPIDSVPAQLPWLGAFRVAPQQPYGRADWDLILRLFVDVAYVRENAPESSQGPPEVNQFLSGAGIGAELSIKSYLRARFDYGWALRDSKDPLEPVKAGSSQIYFQFSLFY